MSAAAVLPSYQIAHRNAYDVSFDLFPNASDFEVSDETQD